MFLFTASACDLPLGEDGRESFD